MIREITQDIVNQTIQGAKTTARKRLHRNFHSSYDEPIQRLLNAIEPYSYIQPHKHENPDKLEIFMVIRGRFLVLIFDETGRITHHSLLDASNGNYGIEIHPGTYHLITSLVKGSVAYEVKDGPYDETADKSWAPWAPPEGSKETREYLDKCFAEVGIYPAE